jgi:CBS domain-containing protein
MIAGDLITQIVSSVRTSDTGEEVLTMMNVFHIKHLPIVNNEELLGVISEDDILSQNIDEAIGTYPLSMRRPYVEKHTHIFDMMRIMSEYKLSIIPVVDKNNKFIGIVLLEDIVNYFASSSTFNQPGGIILIEMNRQDYSLVEISTIVENNHAAILGLFIYPTNNPNSVHVILKLNKINLDVILSALRRYDYFVESSFVENEVLGDLQDRYDSLMNYLNV